MEIGFQLRAFSIFPSLFLCAGCASGGTTTPTTRMSREGSLSKSYYSMTSGLLSHYIDDLFFI